MTSDKKISYFVKEDITIYDIDQISKVSSNLYMIEKSVEIDYRKLLESECRVEKKQKDKLEKIAVSTINQKQGEQYKKRLKTFAIESCEKLREILNETRD